MTSPTVDVLVVGAGSSGAALAARLAEAGAQVLLLEAGADGRSADLPSEWRSPNPIQGFLSPTLDTYVWADLLATRTSVQQPELYWRGRGVGGSSVMNGQIAIRPPLEDFDDWASEGCAGWAGADVLPYFVRLEDDQDFPLADHHGTGGPIPVHRAPQASWGSVDLALRDAALLRGFAWAEDVNAPGATGVSPYPINSRAGARVSTNDAYLEPARGLANLDVRGDALVDRVLFDGSRAIGVSVIVAGHAEPQTLFADRVVLSAGVIASPAILQRSGIGSAGHLESVGVPVRQDLPVGDGMQDHPISLLNIPLRPEHSSGPDGRHTNCCVRYTSGPDGSANDMMLVGLNQNLLALGSADVRAGAGAIGVWVNQVHSRGTVLVSDTDPRKQPTVNQNMLSDPRDLVRLRDGVRMLAELAGTEAFTAITDGDLWRVNEPLREALRGSDADLDRLLLDTAGDTQHGTSTCRMGSPDDPRSVVDAECRVLGTEGLSVVDASVMPSVPRANTHLTAVMLGEVVADRLSRG